MTIYTIMKKMSYFTKTFVYEKEHPESFSEYVKTLEHFMRTFKKTYGLTPSQYRTKYTEI